MGFDLTKPQRRSICLARYDYTEPGAYFVTVCTRGKKCLFGKVVDGEMRLNRWGMIAMDCWQTIPLHFMSVELDAFVVMPNHVHGVIVLIETRVVRATHASPLQEHRGPKRQSLSAMVGSYKSAVTKQINAIRRSRGETLWQRNYYEHVIRDDAEWNLVREYIVYNPERWGEDAENPNRKTEEGQDNGHSRLAWPLAAVNQVRDASTMGMEGA